MKRASLYLRGTLTGPAQGIDRPAAKYIYQKTKPGLGNLPHDPHRREQCRIYAPGTQPNTTAQQPYRARFAIGVATWHTMTPEQKEALRKPATKIGLNRFQYHMRNWCRTTPTPTTTIWDGDNTEWDNNTTTWDGQ